MSLFNRVPKKELCLLIAVRMCILPRENSRVILLMPETDWTQS